jgi:hypothetical protein
MNSFVEYLMQFPAAVGLVNQIVSGIQKVWLGNTSESVSDTVVAAWSIPSNHCNLDNIPEFSAYSLKYAYLLFCWSIW